MKNKKMDYVEGAIKMPLIPSEEELNKIIEEKQNNIVYAEPVDYFPEEIRKEFGLGEYAEVFQDKDAVDPAKKLSDDEKYRLRNSLLDWHYERVYRLKVLQNPEIDEEIRQYSEARIKEAEHYIKLIIKEMFEYK